MSRKYSPQAMEGALAAITKGRLTIPQAYKKYGVPASTIRLHMARRQHQDKMNIKKTPNKMSLGLAKAQKRLNYSPEVLKTALKAISNGKVTVTVASRMYGIPTTTMWKRMQKEKARKVCETRQKQRHYTHMGNLKVAIRAVLQKKLTQPEAIKKYGVSGSTLQRHITNYQTGATSIFPPLITQHKSSATRPKQPSKPQQKSSASRPKQSSKPQQKSSASSPKQSSKPQTKSSSDNHDVRTNK
jgi:hypothetical protein